MNEDLKSWLNHNGMKFLKEIGIKRGYTVVDFGCGEGHYAIPLSYAVGEKGKVYAVDKDMQVLKKLKRYIEKKELNNVKLLANENDEIPLEDNSVDAVLCYDVIHYEKRTKREEIYKEIYRILKPEGFFSLYPKHHKDDYPLKELSSLSLKDIIEEVEKTGFQLKEKLTKRCLHDVYYNECIILNFIPLIRR